MTRVSLVNILIIDDDVGSQSALQQVLGAEDWHLHVAPDVNSALQVLAAGDWTLAMVNVGLTGLGGPLYSTLRELALAPAMEEGKGRVRVLFLVPEAGAHEVQPALEEQHLPYALKPLNLNDVLEKVSDLLLEAGAIPQSIRQVRRDGFASANRRGGGRHGARPGETRNTGMFATREDSYSASEEELAEYERLQQEEVRRKKKNLSDLGSGR